MRLPAPPHLLLGGYCAGLCLALAWRPPLVLLGAAAALRRRACSSRPRGCRRSRTAPALGGRRRPRRACSSAPARWSAAARLDAVGRSTLAAYVGHHVPLTAVLTDLPAIKDDQVTLAVRVTGAAGRELREPAHLRLRLEEGQTLAYDPVGPLTEGAVLRLPSVSVEPLPEPKPGAFDYGRYLRRRGEHVLLDARLRRPDDHRPPRRPAGARRPAPAGVARPPRRRRALAGRRGAAGHGPRRRRGRRPGAGRGLPPQRAAAHHGRVRRERGAAVHHVVVRLRAARHPSPGAHRAAAARGRDLRAAHRRVAVDRARRGGRHRRPAGDPGVAAERRLAALAGAGGVAAHGEPQQPLRRELPAVVRRGRRPARAGAAAHARRLVPPGAAAGAGRGDDGGQHLDGADLRCSRSARRRWSACRPTWPAGSSSARSCSSACCRCCSGSSAEWLSAPLNVVAGLFIGFLLAVSRFFAGLPRRRVRVPGGDAAAGCWSWDCWRSSPWSRCSRRGPAAACWPTCATAAAGRRSPPATAALVAAALLLAPAPARPPDRPTLTFLDVGEGAATLLQVPGRPDGAHRRRARAARRRPAPARACSASTCSCSRTGTPTTWPGSRTWSAACRSPAAVCRTRRIRSQALDDLARRHDGRRARTCAA